MFYERGTLFAIDLKRQPTRLTPRTQADFEEFGHASAPFLAEATGQPAKNIQRRFATGRRCFGARIENQIVAYGWVSQSDECIGEQNREIRIQRSEAYIWDCATAPQYRNQKLYSALLGHILAVLGQEGVKRVWVGTAASNKPSQSGFVTQASNPSSS